MNTSKFSGKRKCSEAPSQNCSQCTVSVAAASSSSSGNGSGSEAASGGGGSTGDVEEEEEPSSSSSAKAIWSITRGNQLSRAKRLKHTLAPVSEHASDEVNTDLSDESLKSEAHLREYGRINEDQLREALRVAGLKGGECVSKVTIGAGETLAFKCRFGHIFKSTVREAESSWCSVCSKYLTQCHEFAEKHNGKLLDADLASPVHFECARGHKFTCKSYRSYLGP